MEIRFNSQRNEHEYLLDGDLWSLLPGREFTSSVEAFRTKMWKMCKKRGIRYRSKIQDGYLWFQAYREVPGDMEPTD